MAKSPPMSSQLKNVTPANSIGICLPFHFTNLCEINHRHHRHQRGGMAVSVTLFATPAAAATAVVDPLLT